MLLGNVAYIYLVFYPALKQYTKHEEEILDAPKRFPVGTLIEFLIYELISFMMIWSHMATMCVQPGFVPKNYQY